MIELTLTESQASLVWLALKQAEANALDNKAVSIADQLLMVRLELEYKRKEYEHEPQPINLGLGW